MGIASIVSALSGYVVLILVARGLPPDVNADFLVFWSLLFGGFGVLGGIQQETTRAVGMSQIAGTRPRGVRVLPVALLVAVALAGLVAVAAPLWRPAMLPGQTGWAAAAVCLSWICYAGHLQVIGALAGRRQWSVNAVIIGGESALRLVLVAMALLIGAGLFGVEVASAASVVLWFVVLALSRRARRAAAARGDDGWRVLLRRLLQAMLASAGSAVLVVGFPTLLRATTDDATWAGAAPLVLAISMTRAPLMLPLTAYQSVVISYFLDPPGRRSAALLKIVGAVGAVGAIGALAAALLGPWLMVTFFGPEYRMSGLVLGALTAASAVLAALTVTGACVLAVGRHTAFATGWLAAAGVAVGVLLLPLTLDLRAVLALACGPLVGLFVHVAALKPVLRDGARARAEGPTAS